MNKLLYILIILQAVLMGATENIFSTEKLSISVNDLSGKYRIIGPLGKELGKGLTLEVKKIKVQEKSDPDLLEVYSVDGVLLKKPVILPYKMFLISDEFQLNKKIKIKAYQDMIFEGVPEDVLKEIMVQAKSYYLSSVLVVYKFFGE